MQQQQREKRRLYAQGGGGGGGPDDFMAGSGLVPETEENVLRDHRHHAARVPSGTSAHGFEPLVGKCAAALHDTLG